MYLSKIAPTAAVEMVSACLSAYVYIEATKDKKYRISPTLALSRDAWSAGLDWYCSILSASRDVSGVRGWQEISARVRSDVIALCATHHLATRRRGDTDMTGAFALMSAGKLDELPAHNVWDADQELLYNAAHKISQSGHFHHLWGAMLDIAVARVELLPYLSDLPKIISSNSIPNK